MPPEYHLGDKPLYLKAVEELAGELFARRASSRRTEWTSALDMLSTLDPEIQGAKIDVAKTFDDRFVKRASA